MTAQGSYKLRARFHRLKSFAASLTIEATAKPPSKDAEKPKPSPWERHRRALAQAIEEKGRLSQEVGRLKRNQRDGGEWAGEDYSSIEVGDATGNVIETKTIKPGDLVAVDAEGNHVGYDMREGGAITVL